MQVQSIKKGVVQKFREVKSKLLIFLSLIIFVLLSLEIISYVGQELGGEYNWLTLSSELFGMPEELKEGFDTECLFKSSDTGWDGQFYYYISNDILGVRGYDKFIDSPPYRWQRIGLPLMAKILSMMLLQKNVSVILYIFLSLFIVTLGFYIGARYISGMGKSVFWALPWLCSCGVFINMRHAFPDGVADALFIIAFIMLLRKKYIWYAFCMTLTCLSREGYILIAFCVFLIFLCNRLDDYKLTDKKIKYYRFIVMAFPGIVWGLWYLYVSIHFNEFPFKSAYGVTQFFLVGWFNFFCKAVSSGDVFQILGLSAYIIFIIASFVLSLYLGNKNIIYWVFVPYTVLVGSFGPTVLASWAGYLKGISVLFFLVPFMLLQCGDAYIIIKTDEGDKEVNVLKMCRQVMVIILIFLTGFSGKVISMSQQNLVSNRYLFPLPEVKEEEIPNLTDFSNNISMENFQYLKHSKIPEVFVKPYAICEVKVNNLSEQTWSYAPNADGTGAVYLSYQFIKDGKVVLDGGRFAFDQDILPGEEAKREMYIDYPKDKGAYILRISLLQEGVSWFYSNGTGYVDKEIHVR